MTLQDLHTAYKEDCNCGYVGSFAEYLISVGVNLSELDIDSIRKEGEKTE